MRKVPGARVDMDPKSTVWKGPELLVTSVSMCVPGGCGAGGLGRGGGAALPETWLGEGRWGQQREEGVWVVAGKRRLFRKRETGSRARAGTPEGTGTPEDPPRLSPQVSGLGQQTRVIHKDPAGVSREPCVYGGFASISHSVFTKHKRRTGSEEKGAQPRPRLGEGGTGAVTL